jgi:hypothetical protein
MKRFHGNRRAPTSTIAKLRKRQPSSESPSANQPVPAKVIPTRPQATQSKAAKERRRRDLEWKVEAGTDGKSNEDISFWAQRTEETNSQYGNQKKATKTVLVNKLKGIIVGVLFTIGHRLGVEGCEDGEGRDKGARATAKPSETGDGGLPNVKAVGCGGEGLVKEIART